MININDFLTQMIIYFPETSSEINERMKDAFDGLDTIIIEENIMPNVLALLKKNNEIQRLKKIFEYFEDVCNNADEYLLNVFSITTLEILGNEKNILETAKKYMGPVTTKLQREADIDIGRQV